MQLHDEESMKQLTQDYISSNEWWMFIHTPPGLLEMIEEKFYSGDANEDFHILIGRPFPGMSVAFAHKRRMSAGELADILGQSEERFLENDVLSISESRDDEPRVIEEVIALNNWVYGLA